MNTDRIEKSIVLRAPQARVWRALAQADQFGAWFGMTLTGAFEPGARVTGRLTEPGYEHLTVEMFVEHGTVIQADIIPIRYEHLTVEMFVERVEPETLLAYHWHPRYVDGSHE